MNDIKDIRSIDTDIIAFLNDEYNQWMIENLSTGRYLHMEPGNFWKPYWVVNKDGATLFETFEKAEEYYNRTRDKV